MSKLQQPVLAIVFIVCLSLVSPSAICAKEKTVVDFWWGGIANYTENMMQLVQDFNEQNTSVEVRMTVQPHIGMSGVGIETLKTAIAGGAQPDVVVLDGTILIGLAIEDGLFMDLREIIDPSFLYAIPYAANIKNYVMFRDSVYGIHFQTDARGLYFNQTHFAEVGLDPRKGPKSIDELDQYAAKLTRRDAQGRIERQGYSPRGGNFGLELGWFWVFGGNVFDYNTMLPTFTNNEAHLAALRWIESYADKYSTAAITSAGNNFMAGKVSMSVQSTSLLGTLPVQAPDMEWWVSTIPYPPEGRLITMSSGYSAAVPKGAKNAVAAAEFIHYLIDKNTQMNWYRMTKTVPTRVDAILELIQKREITDPRAICMIELMPTAAEIYPPLFVNYVLPQLSNYINQMWNKQIPPAEVLEKVQFAVEPEYRRIFHGKAF